MDTKGCAQRDPLVKPEPSSFQVPSNQPVLSYELAFVTGSVSHALVDPSFPDPSHHPCATPLAGPIVLGDP
ncbi:hypothetical protein NKR23_g3824 [Pleurostoma richardsiae]|uniref:Uncharacterized protein n=1 Tax=Pleurostoma richardsiae TaxID=41990 RepID=A0AA38VT93_9PEZI|nr:hypothetical protein NKR23_g3824 [Pleurostoma richardsiae]